MELILGRNKLLIVACLDFISLWFHVAVGEKNEVILWWRRECEEAYRF